jgi:hypothetical protein
MYIKGKEKREGRKREQGNFLEEKEAELCGDSNLICATLSRSISIMLETIQHLQATTPFHAFHIFSANGYSPHIVACI